MWGSCWAPTLNPGVPGAPKMSANADLITVEICTTRENNLNPNFSFMGTNVFFFIYFGAILVFSDQTGPILLSSYPLTHIFAHVK